MAVGDKVLDEIIMPLPRDIQVGERFKWDVTSHVQDIVEYQGGIDSFYGWAIEQSGLCYEYNDYYMRYVYYSRESSFISRQPKLIVTYIGSEPPEDLVDITQPVELGIYIGGKLITQLSSSTYLPVAVIISGDLVIKADSCSTASISRVEFSVGDMDGHTDSHTDYSAPYEWDWHPQGIGFNLYELSVKAFSNDGKTGEDNFIIVKVT